MWLVIIGVVLVLVGVGCLYGARLAQREVYAMVAAETLSVPELEELRHISDELGATGGFRKTCEVVGDAHPSPQGLLRAELSGVECVWHRHRIERRYKHYDRDSDGRTRVCTRTETVAEHTSGPGFALIRDGRTIGVDHGGRRPTDVEQVASRFTEGEERDPGGWTGMLGTLVGGDRDVTIGYQHTEWALRPGTRMYVLGEVHDRIGPLVIGPPEDPKQPFVLSTKSEQQLTADARDEQRLLAWGGLALMVLGLVLAVFGLL